MPTRKRCDVQDPQLAEIEAAWTAAVLAHASAQGREDDILLAPGRPVEHTDTLDEAERGEVETLYADAARKRATAHRLTLALRAPVPSGVSEETVKRLRGLIKTLRTIRGNHPASEVVAVTVSAGAWGEIARDIEAALSAARPSDVSR